MQDLNCGGKYEHLNDRHSSAHNLSIVNLKPEKKNSGLDGIWTHDLRDTIAVLSQLSHLANWELGPFLKPPGNYQAR